MLRKHISQYANEELQSWLQNLVEDQIPESITLEYKSGQAFTESSRKEIAKDISSFANTKGGVIIYGIPERRGSGERDYDTIPCSEYGLNPIPNFVSRLLDMLTDTISPPLPDLWIREVPLLGRPEHVVYVVWHPESWLLPHMVQGHDELCYYRRASGRAIIMTESEVREAYLRTQRSAERAQQLFDSQDINYIRQFFPQEISLSHAVSCPHLLVADRVDYASNDMQEWLGANPYPEMRGIRASRIAVPWYPSMHGAQAGVTGGMTLAPPELVRMHHWVELHRNGALNCLWQTHIITIDDRRLLAWKDEIGRLSAFTGFAKDFYARIGYYGPLRFRFSISNLRWVGLVPTEDADPLDAYLPEDTFRADFTEDSARLFENPNSVLQAFADRLFQAYGRWQGPPL